MGISPHLEVPDEIVDAALAGDPYRPANIKAAAQPFQHNEFRYFDCPTLDATGHDSFRHGSRFKADDEDRLEYLYWNDLYESHSEMWEEREGERDVMEEEDWLESYGAEEARKLGDDDKARDEAALDLLLSAVKGRAMASN
ncbi:hypothetical protein G7Z17_g799 [Cylindrodendrum hubeiense]|uniref:Uncharacterized protein n=1 Tax=Cylindrodendrum hubeiense TaxID=595255 RepID=A0A9P5HH37_9HYPO|nr:hypothetical protein G7Z17_g799 [Cylindrodendrum hubeiense]